MNKIIKLIIIGVISMPLFSQGKISVYMFGDYFYVLSHNDTLIKGMNGFWLRRIYFTYDYDISESFSTRLRIELNSSGDFNSSTTLVPYAKDAYLKWKIKSFDLFLGISPTPTWEVIEEHFGYRFLEKTPVDLQKMGSARDFGFALRGGFVEGKVKFHFLFGNGEGIKAEFNKQKAYYLSFGFYPGKFLLEIYGDYFDALGHNQVYTFQGFLGFKNEKLKFGLQFANQTHLIEPDTSINYRVGSGYFVFNISEKLVFLLRYDKMFEKNPQGDKIVYIPFSKDAPSNLVITGIHFKPHNSVHFMPNIKYVFYDEENGRRPEPDMYINLTFFYKF